MIMTRYIIKQVKNFKDLRVQDIKGIRELIDEHQGDFNHYDFCNADIGVIVANYRFMLCYCDDKLVGLSISSLGEALFDVNVKILSQKVIVARKGFPRAAYLLYRDFIDFGKTKADHILTMIGENTNVNPKTLEKIGFKKIETYYRLEV